MRLHEILRKENVGKIFEFNGDKFEAQLKGNNVQLISEDDGSCIEDIFFLDVLVNGDFYEIGYIEE